MEQYFRVRRRSGGGDCGALREVKPNIYCIAFKDQKDQQRVLQKFEHVLEFADGSLVFMVRESLDPPNTSTPVHSPAARNHIPVSGAHPSGAESELQLDASILPYVSECPSARKELDKELASLACCVWCHPEGDGALFWRSGPVGVADSLEDEQGKVFDELFERIEEGQGSSVQETETRVCQLAEAKRRLLWGEIRGSLEQEILGVKVMQGDSGQIFLEGSVVETQKAADLIFVKERLVLERTVPCMSPRLLAFLRRKYEGLEVLENSVGVNNRVEPEFGDTELHLFSLSADKLDKTEQVLRDKFREVKLDVSNCSALTSELRLKLDSKVKEMNQRVCRAEVCFDSGSTVHLFGYMNEVEELNEIVKKVILGPSCTETIVFPSPEAAERFPEFQPRDRFDQLK